MSSSNFKVSYVMVVLNGEPFIKFQLQSIYKHAHEIIIVEGAYKKFSFAAKEFRSKDKTISIIENFPDPKKKIKLIKKKIFYDDKKEMCNEFMKYITGDVLWQIDVDEFYDENTHKYVKQIFSKDDLLDQVSFTFYDYYKTFDWIINGYPEQYLDVIRVNRIFKGMTWVNQRPPTLEFNNKIIIPRKKINGMQMLKNNHYMHNLTMIYDSQVKDKFIFYNKKSLGIFSGNDQWYTDSWKNYSQKFSVAGFKSFLTYLTKREHQLPKIMEKILLHTKKKSNIKFKFNSDVKIKKTVCKKNYRNLMLLANQINSLEKEFFFVKLYISIILLIKISTTVTQEDKSFFYLVLLRKLIPKFVKKLFKVLNSN